MPPRSRWGAPPLRGGLNTTPDGADLLIFTPSPEAPTRTARSGRRARSGSDSLRLDLWDGRCRPAEENVGVEATDMTANSLRTTSVRRGRGGWAGGLDRLLPLAGPSTSSPGCWVSASGRARRARRSAGVAPPGRPRADRLLRGGDRTPVDERRAVHGGQRRRHRQAAAAGVLRRHGDLSGGAGRRRPGLAARAGRPPGALAGPRRTRLPRRQQGPVPAAGDLPRRAARLGGLGELGDRAGRRDDDARRPPDQDKSLPLTRQVMPGSWPPTV